MLGFWHVIGVGNGIFLNRLFLLSTLSLSQLVSKICIFVRLMALFIVNNKILLPVCNNRMNRSLYL